MSNILIIKQGSLGDIVQISGVLRDIKDYHRNDKVFILTTFPYTELLSMCPFVDAVLVDKRLPRWNIFYLIKLNRLIKKFSFTHAYDLQNSSRTSFYRKFIFNIKNWSSSRTTLPKNTTKKIFNKKSVLERFEHQLQASNIQTKYSLKPDFSWAAINVDQITNKFFGKKFILIFPLCSPKLSHKQWPYYNNLINLIKSHHSNLEVVIAPGPNEINEAKKINAISITNDKKALNIMELAGLIKKSNFIIANDTGPAHMAAHLGSEGIVLFGYHTTPEKVSIETSKFKAVAVKDLKSLSADEVYVLVKDQLKLIN